MTKKSIFNLELMMYRQKYSKNNPYYFILLKKYFLLSMMHGWASPKKMTKEFFTTLRLKNEMSFILRK